MWAVRHEASKTDEEIFWALSFLALFNYLLCPDMKLASGPFSHTLRTKRPATKCPQQTGFSNPNVTVWAPPPVRDHVPKSHL